VAFAYNGNFFCQLQGPKGYIIINIVLVYVLFLNAVGLWV